MRRLAKNRFEAWAEVVAHDYEGLVAKEESRLYGLTLEGDGVVDRDLVLTP